MTMKTLHNFVVKASDGSDFDMSELSGRKVLIVNVASECGFTSQYAQLQELYEKTSREEVEIVAFPCNQFGGQEPGSDEEIQNFCSVNFGVSFPLMAKVDVKGPNAAPLYNWLTKLDENGITDTEVEWNFRKFLVNEDGSWHSTHAPGVSPHDLELSSWLGVTP